MSHTKDSGFERQNFFVRYFEYARAITEVVVTDEGVYLKDEVPESYGGAQLEVKIVNAIFMVNARAEMQIFEFENDPPMDKDKKKGGPIKRNGVEIRAATGDSSTIVNQTLVLNEQLDAARKLLGKAAYDEMQAVIAERGITPPS